MEESENHAFLDRILTRTVPGSHTYRWRRAESNICSSLLPTFSHVPLGSLHMSQLQCPVYPLPVSHSPNVSTCKLRSKSQAQLCSLVLCPLSVTRPAYLLLCDHLSPFPLLPENIEPSSVYPSWGVFILPTEVILIFLLFLTATAAINAPFPTPQVGSGVYNNKLHYSSTPHV